MPLYIWFGIEHDGQTGISLSSVSYDGADFPVTKQADAVDGYDIYVADMTHVWSEVNAHPFELVLAKDAAAPNTYNRYCVVTDDAVPTAADFLSDDATHSDTISILIPNSGWTDGRGFLHFALPSGQDAPTIAGLPGGTNLIDDFAVRSRANTVDVNGDDMRTLSSESEVFQMTDLYSLFPWIVR